MQQSVQGLHRILLKGGESAYGCMSARHWVKMHVLQLCARQGYHI